MCYPLMKSWVSVATLLPKAPTKQAPLGHWLPPRQGGPEAVNPSEGSVRSGPGKVLIARTRDRGSSKGRRRLR